MSSCIVVATSNSVISFIKTRNCCSSSFSDEVLAYCPRLQQSPLCYAVVPPHLHVVLPQVHAQEQVYPGAHEQVAVPALDARHALVLAVVPALVAHLRLVLDPQMMPAAPCDALTT